MQRWRRRPVVLARSRNRAARAAAGRYSDALDLVPDFRLLRDPALRDFDLRGGGTLPPAFRASDNPIAIACLRDVTRFPDRPLRSVPSLRSCIARSTLLWAFFPYFAMIRTPLRLRLRNVARSTLHVAPPRRLRYFVT